jgi:hypothetical protein
MKPSKAGNERGNKTDMQGWRNPSGEEEDMPGEYA